MWAWGHLPTKAAKSSSPTKMFLCATLRVYASSRDGGKKRALVSGVSPSTPPACVVPPVALSTPSLLPVASLSTHPSRGLDAFDDANQACSVMYLYGCEQYLALATQPTKPTFDWIYLALEHLLVSIMLALGSPSSKRGLMLRRRVTATLLTASPILTLRNIAQTQMKPSWVI